MDDGRNILSDDKAKALMEIIGEWETGRVFTIPARCSGKTAAMKEALERAEKQAQQIKERLTEVWHAPSREELLTGAHIEHKEPTATQMHERARREFELHEADRRAYQEPLERLAKEIDMRLERLQSRKGGKEMIYAVDFDGTLCEKAWPEIGEPKEGVLAFCRGAKEAGHKLILWTNRSGELLEQAVAWCAERGVHFDAVNENLPEVIEEYGGDSRKITADRYIDDKSLDPEAIEDNWRTYKRMQKARRECGLFDKTSEMEEETNND